MPDPNPLSSSTDSESNPGKENTQINDNNRLGRKRVKLRDSREVKIFNIRNEINRMYLDLKNINNKEDIRTAHEDILIKLRRIILLKNTDSGAYYMAGLCCDEILEYLIENENNSIESSKIYRKSNKSSEADNKSDENTEKALDKEDKSDEKSKKLTKKEYKKLKLKYLNLSHSFYNCYVRLTKRNENIIRTLLQQTTTLLSEYTDLLSKKQIEIHKQEMVKYLSSLFEINTKQSKLTTKNFEKQLRKLRKNEYLGMQIDISIKFNMDVNVLKLLIKLEIVDLTDICCENIKNDPTLNSQTTFDSALDCTFLKELQIKYRDIVPNESYKKLGEDLKNNFNKFNMSDKGMIVNGQLKNLIRYLKRKIYVFDLNISDSQFPTLHSLLCTYTLFVINAFLFKKYCAVIKAVNLLNARQSMYMNQFMQRQFYFLKVLGLLSVEYLNVQKSNKKKHKQKNIPSTSEINSINTTDLQSDNENTKAINIEYSTDFMVQDYEPCHLNYLAILSNIYMKNKEYEKLSELIEFLNTKIVNLSDTASRKTLFNLLYKKAIILKKTNGSVDEQIITLKRAAELWPEDNRPNVKLSEIYTTLGHTDMAKLYIGKSNRLKKEEYEISDTHLEVEGDTVDLFLRLKDMFPKLQEIYYENIFQGGDADISLYNSYMMISRHMVRSILRCPEFNRTMGGKYNFDREFSGISLSNWTYVIEAHIFTSINLFELLNPKLFIKVPNYAENKDSKKMNIKGAKILWDALTVLEKASCILYLRNYGKKKYGVYLYLLKIWIISKYNKFMYKKPQEDLLTTVVKQGKRLLTLLNDLSAVYLLFGLFDRLKMHGKFVGSKNPIETTQVAALTRHISRILYRKLGCMIKKEQNNENQRSSEDQMSSELHEESSEIDPKQEKLKKKYEMCPAKRMVLIEKLVTCSSLHNIFNYTYKRISELYKELESHKRVPVHICITYAKICFSHSASRTVTDRNIIIESGFNTLFKALSLSECDYEQILEYEKQNTTSMDEAQREVVLKDKANALALIDYIKYNIGRGYHNFKLFGVAEKYYWSCKYSSDIRVRNACFLNLLMIYQDNKNTLCVEKLYREFDVWYRD